MISLLCDLKCDTINLPMKQKQTHSIGNKPVVAEVRGGAEWESGVSRPRALYGEWINNTLLLDIAGESVPCPVINHNGKEC